MNWSIPPARIALLLAPSLVILLLAPWPTLVEALAYRRPAVGEGAIWLLFTGNFVHFTLYHTMMNALGLAALSLLLFGTLALRTWLVSLAVVTLSVGLGLHLFSTDLYEYRGMSGAVYGLLAAGLVLTFERQRLVNALVLALLLGKIIYEQLPVFDANYLIEQIGVPVAADAHLYGTVSGILVALALRLYNRRFQVYLSPSHEP